jgi:hypothetical protein
MEPITLRQHWLDAFPNSILPSGYEDELLQKEWEFQNSRIDDRTFKNLDI